MRIASFSQSSYIPIEISFSILLITLTWNNQITHSILECYFTSICINSFWFSLPINFDICYFWCTREVFFTSYFISIFWVITSFTTNTSLITKSPSISTISTLSYTSITVTNIFNTIFLSSGSDILISNNLGSNTCHNCLGCSRELIPSFGIITSWTLITLTISLSISIIFHNHFSVTESTASFVFTISTIIRAPNTCSINISIIRSTFTVLVSSSYVKNGDLVCNIASFLVTFSISEYSTSTTSITGIRWRTFIASFNTWLTCKRGSKISINCTTFTFFGLSKLTHCTIINKTHLNTCIPTW